jgi:hypothetical protein
MLEVGRRDQEFSMLNLGIITIRSVDLSLAILPQICWTAVILFSPSQQLTRRLAFVVLGVITLIALSEISKLNLHQYLQPARVSDNSLPLAAQFSLCGIPIYASIR